MTVDLPSKTFCVFPWIHLAITTEGEYHPCCFSNESFRKPDGTSYRVPLDTIQDVWNSESYQQLRSKMLAGEWAMACNRCEKEEQAGIESTRLSYNERFAHEITESVLSTTVDIQNIRYLDLRLGNLCNIKCRMCNPSASTQWIQEWVDSGRLSNIQADQFGSINWPQLEQFWDQLLPLLDHVELIYLAGGEPTLIKEQYRMLEYCIERDLAKKITLKYNINLTNIPSKLLHYWQYFHNVDISCSIDGIGAMNDYIRFPSKWKSVSKNFHKLYEMGQARGNMRLRVQTTVQVYNAFGIGELIDYMADYGIVPHMNMLRFPREFSIKCLPYRLKTMLVEYLNAIRTRHNDPFVDEACLRIANYAQHEDKIGDWDKFFETTERMDAYRGQDWRTVMPEIHAYIESRNNAGK